MKVTILTNELWPDTGGVGRYINTLASELTKLTTTIVLTNREHKKTRSNFNIDATLYRSFRNPFKLAANLVRLAIHPLYNRKTEIITGCYGSLLLATVAGNLIPQRYYTILHGSELLKCIKLAEKNIVFRKLFELTLINSNQIICISKTVFKILENSNYAKLTKGKSTIIYNAIDPLFYKKQETQINKVNQPQKDKQESLNILTVGRLDFRKRIDLVMHALALSNANIHFHIVGEGGRRKNLENLATSLNIRDRVIFHGRVNDITLENLYCACDFYIACAGRYKDTIEGFGLTIIEAAVHGTKVIALDEDGAGEIARMIDAKVVNSDPKEIAHLLTNLSNGSHCRQWAPSRIIKEFSPEKQANDFLRLLSKSAMEDSKWKTLI